ncbi:MAG: hypothetical protein OXF02_05115 [Simkaniaceae bacterium]|nr:hypothetical protein [Simkaniaceae bacterium]
MVGPIEPPTVVVDRQPGNIAPVVNQLVVAPAVANHIAPVVNQPVVAPAVANHIAPAVVADNVAQGALTNRKKFGIAVGALIGEGVAGFVCSSGAVVGAVTKLEQMGATTAVTTGTLAGVVIGGILCTLGAMVATGVHYDSTLPE